MPFTKEDLLKARTRDDLVSIAEQKGINIERVLDNLEYKHELLSLQEELVKLQQWIINNKMRVAIIFEGRDAAGKGGAIKRFIEHLIPRSMRVVALNKPTENEKGQWYFRRYLKELPNPGEMVFFDRSWYNRAVVEPVMGFCTKEQYATFMRQVTEFEHMLYEDGLVIIKFWFAISKKEQRKRIQARIENPAKSWKFSPIDKKGMRLWDEYTYYRERMFNASHTDFSPWILVTTNDKKTARLESIRYVLSRFDYPNKNGKKLSLLPDPNIVGRYYRKSQQLDD